MNPSKGIDLISRSVGAWAMNAYVLVCTETHQSVLIDPGAEPDSLEEMMAGTTPVAILITHSHPDHIGALDEMRHRLDVPVMAHPGLPPDNRNLSADRWLADGDGLPVGRQHLQVHHTPGHTRDQVCFAVQDSDAIIVGDTLFPGGPGMTRSHQDFETTRHTLLTRVLTWPDSSICYPGHGDCFKLGEIRLAVEAFLEKDHGSFFGHASWEM